MNFINGFPPLEGLTSHHQLSPLWGEILSFSRVNALTEKRKKSGDFPNIDKKLGRMPHVQKMRNSQNRSHT